MKGSAATLFEDFERQALSELHPCRAQDGAHGFRRASLAADDFTQILGMHTQFQDGDSVHRLPHLTPHTFFGMIHQSLLPAAMRFNKFFHGALHNSGCAA